MTQLIISSLLFLLFTQSFFAQTKVEFSPDKGIHPYYLNQMPGFNEGECKEKSKCRSECPQVVRNPGFLKHWTQVYDRNECLRKCDQLTCNLNRYP